MHIAMGQIAPVLGDFDHNKTLMLNQAHEALGRGVDLLVFPELSLSGYPPNDVLERPEFISQQQLYFQELVKELPEPLHCLIGYLETSHMSKLYFDSAALVSGGQVLQKFHKQHLPSYDVFDDGRHFLSGELKKNRFLLKNKWVQLLICEDMWAWDPPYTQNPMLSIGKEDVDIVVNMSASPYHLGKLERRIELAKKTALHWQAPLFYINQVGGQDELIFDGQSFVIDSQGRLVGCEPAFNTSFGIYDSEKLSANPKETQKETSQDLRQALVLGVRDFFRKNNISRGHLGLSGGIDSAVVLCLLVEALGAERVTALSLPSRFNQELSFNLSQEMAKRVGCHFHKVPIDPLYQLSLDTYEQTFGKRSFSLMHENLQARLRGLMLMAFANDNNSMLVSTSNKSEMAMGYSTLYGDMCGGLAPLGDLLKGQVYGLAKLYRDEKQWVPQEVIDRPPSAELRENQKDSDSLPDYNELDDSVDHVVTRLGEVRNSTDKVVLHSLYATEFKRWQSPPILKVSAHAFGRGRRLPISLARPWL